MQSITPLIDYFQKIVPLTENEQKWVSEYFKPRLYRKRQYILQQGDKSISKIWHIFIRNHENST